MFKKSKTIPCNSTKAHTISVTILTLAIVTLILNHYYFFYGYFGYDDMHYSKLSYLLLKGESDFADHYSYRWTILYLTALSYYFFGISDFATAFPALMLSFGILFLIFINFKDSVFLLISTLLLFFSIRWNVFYTDKLMPDMFVSFFLFTAWLSFVRWSKNNHYYFYSTVFVISLFLAFLSKGTAILITPLLILYFILDFKSGNLAKWKYPILMGGFLIILYIGLIYVLTGHPFSRFYAIQDNSYFNSCSYNEMPISETLDRVTSGFLKLIWNESLIIFLVIVFIAKLYAFFYVKSTKSKKRINFYSNTVLVLFLSMNFMTISLDSYNPTCLDIRHYLFAVPIMSVCVGYILKDLGLSKSSKLIVLTLALICIIPTIKHMYYAKSLNYKDTKDDIIKLITNFQNEDITIVSNQVMINLISFYSLYQYKGKLCTVKNFEDEKCEDNCFLISNWYSEFHSGTDLNQIITELKNGKNRISIYPQVYEGFKGLTLYKIDKNKE